MPEGVTTPDGKPLDLAAAEQDFARAMSAPPADDIPAPPARPPADQDSRQKPAVRGKAPAKPRVKSPAPLKADYTDDAQQLVTTAWTVAAALPPTQAYATVINANADALTAALAQGAKHSEGIRNMLTGTGENAWKAQLAMVAVNMAMQTMQLMRDADLRAKAAEQTHAQMKALVESAAAPEVPADDVG